MTHKLDDIEKIRANDPGNMYNRIFDLPEQMEEAIRIAKQWDVSKDHFPEPKNLVVIGMGGSAIGGDLVRTLLASHLLIPFQICRNYVLPEYVDDESIVIASSYSGNTEETLAALEDALERKAMIAAITTGGLLQEVADLNEIPIAKIPTGLQPRAAIGYSFVPILIFLEKIGLLKKVEKDLEQTIKKLKQLREEYIESESFDKNKAKQIAEKLSGKIPIIYGGPTLTDVIAVRWKGQICENGKTMSFANQYPEWNHNELVGWSKEIEKHKDHLIAIQLRDKDDHKKIVRRMDIINRQIKEREIEVIEIESIGDSPLERMFSLIQLGDFISYYLASMNEVDPTPVEAIEKLKAQLS